jgi:hypothetical protein
MLASVFPVRVSVQHTLKTELFAGQADGRGATFLFWWQRALSFRPAPQGEGEFSAAFLENL